MEKKIHIKNLIGRDNRWLDLSERKIKFNIDHLFKIPATNDSLVFFPYQIDVSEIDEFNKYCNSNDYRVVFIGGESFYGGKSPYTNGTMASKARLNLPLGTSDSDKWKTLKEWKSNAPKADSTGKQIKLSIFTSILDSQKYGACQNAKTIMEKYCRIRASGVHQS